MDCSVLRSKLRSKLVQWYLFRQFVVFIFSALTPYAFHVFNQPMGLVWLFPINESYWEYHKTYTVQLLFFLLPDYIVLKKLNIPTSRFLFAHMFNIWRYIPRIVVMASSYRATLGNLGRGWLVCVVLYVNWIWYQIAIKTLEMMAIAAYADRKMSLKTETKDTLELNESAVNHKEIAANPDTEISACYKCAIAESWPIGVVNRWLYSNPETEKKSTLVGLFLLVITFVLFTVFVFYQPEIPLFCDGCSYWPTACFYFYGLPAAGYVPVRNDEMETCVECLTCNIGIGNWTH